MLTGYLPPTSGKLKIEGMDVEENPIETKCKIGYLPENNPLYYEMKVDEFLRFIGNLRKIENIHKRVKEVTEKCGLVDVTKKEIGELSRGYRQRVGLAQAIMHNPDILVLDEPTEGLDPNQVVSVRELIKEIGKERTVLLSTHRLAEVEATCNRVIIINKGKIVADGTRDELHTMAKGREIVELEIKSEEDVSSILNEQEWIQKVEKKNGGYEIEAEEGMDIRENIFRFAVNSGWIIIDMHKKLASLEDVFRELTKEG
jgi:ABC-2 type transport system ATP-binding protein